MAKIGDDADGVHVFSGRSDISNEADADEWIKARGREVDQLRSMPTWKHVKLKVLKRLGIEPVRTMFVDKVRAHIGWSPPRVARSRVARLRARSARGKFGVGARSRSHFPRETNACPPARYALDSGGALRAPFQQFRPG